jgi:hypothetical protein
MSLADRVRHIEEAVQKRRQAVSANQRMFDWFHNMRQHHTEYLRDLAKRIVEVKPLPSGPPPGWKPREPRESDKKYPEWFNNRCNRVPDLTPDAWDLELANRMIKAVQSGKYTFEGDGFRPRSWRRQSATSVLLSESAF